MSSTSTHWFPQKYLFEFDHSSDFIVMILNTPISNPSFLKELWKRASFRVLVDGGANHWFSIKDSSSPPPNLISGDFDSVQVQEILNFFRPYCEIVETPDQDHTDFTKSLFEIFKRESLDKKPILVYVEHSGRLDQIFANIKTLYTVQQQQQQQQCSRDVYLINGNSLTWLLAPGHHVLHFLQKNKRKAYIGLIPLGQKAESVTTTGLKWNLKDSTLSFDSLVSTSNTLSDSPNLTITTPYSSLLFIISYE